MAVQAETTAQTVVILETDFVFKGNCYCTQYKYENSFYLVAALCTFFSPKKGKVHIEMNQVF